MAKLALIKTKENETNVADFINDISDEQKRKDSFDLIQLLQKMSNHEPKMWGKAIIGFGNLIYKSPTSGREVAWFKIGFSPRKANLTLYFINMKIHSDSLEKLGKHKVGGGCLYIKKLSDINSDVLKKMIVTTMKS